MDFKPDTSFSGTPQYVLTPTPVQQVGWECPKCKKVWSPYTSECHHCNDKMNVDIKSATVG